MSHKTEHFGHWEGLEMWLSVTTDSILPKAAEALRHQTQHQLDDNITSIMRQDPSQSYSHKEFYLLRTTSSPEVGSFLDRQPVNTKTDYQRLRKALIKEFADPESDQGLVAALETRQ